jgi:hypothetical protein
MRIVVLPLFLLACHSTPAPSNPSNAGAGAGGPPTHASVWPQLQKLTLPPGACQGTDAGAMLAAWKARDSRKTVTTTCEARDAGEYECTTSVGLELPAKCHDADPCAGDGVAPGCEEDLDQLIYKVNADGLIDAQTAICVAPG